MVLWLSFHQRTFCVEMSRITTGTFCMQSECSCLSKSAGATAFKPVALATFQCPRGASRPACCLRSKIHPIAQQRLHRSFKSCTLCFYSSLNLSCCCFFIIKGHTLCLLGSQRCLIVSLFLWRQTSTSEKLRFNETAEKLSLLSNRLVQ